MKRKWIVPIAIALIFPAASASSELLFEEHFDGQKDWTSGLGGNDRDGDGVPDTVQSALDGYTVPDGWYSIRQAPVWAPSTGYPNAHENIEILSSNSAKARGGAGKSLVVWRDSTTGPDWQWNSDGILSKYFPGGYKELYVTFWVRFDPNWTPLGNTGQTKLFRISSWDETGNIYKAFETGDNSAIFVWDYRTDDYGARNKLAVRADPQETNYYMTNPLPENMPRKINNGSLSLNFDSDVIDLNGDGISDNDPFKLKTGATVSGIVSHEELWGDEWHKVAFYIRMNSAPGKLDGALVQWLDGQIVFRNTTMPWMGFNSEGGLNWNVVHFGGNSHFHAYPDSDQREEWVSFDDIEIYSGLPAGVTLSSKPPPAPPSDLNVN